MVQPSNGSQTPRFAEDDGEAERRFSQYGSKDPFPEIPPALLNSADIIDYVAATGMIFPFEENDRLKPASYRIDMLGQCVYWDESGKTDFVLTAGQELILKPNSIVFVTVEPMFRIPDYIALRFNLQISHVYKGLLVGTGPLVDPGFVGRLSLPLHNLTANQYTLKGGDPIIWMEFTKLSPSRMWSGESGSIKRIGRYFPFPERKRSLRGIDDYIEKAIGRDRKIVSSIPVEVEKAHEKASMAADSAVQARDSARSSHETVTTALADLESVKASLLKSVEVGQLSTNSEVAVAKAETKAAIEGIAKQTTRWSAAATIIVVVLSLASVLALILPSMNLVRSTIDSVKKEEEQFGQQRERITALEKEVEDLKNQLAKSQNNAKPLLRRSRRPRRARRPVR